MTLFVENYLTEKEIVEALRRSAHREREAGQPFSEHIDFIAANLIEEKAADMVAARKRLEDLDVEISTLRMKYAQCLVAMENLGKAMDVIRFLGSAGEDG